MSTASPSAPRRLLARFRQDAFWYRQRGAALSFAILALMLVALSVIVPQSFYSGTNLSNLAGQLAPLFLVSLGQTFVLLGAGFDLSVGAVNGLDAVAWIKRQCETFPALRCVLYTGPHTTAFAW